MYLTTAAFWIIQHIRTKEIYLKMIKHVNSVFPRYCLTYTYENQPREFLNLCFRFNEQLK